MNFETERIRKCVLIVAVLVPFLILGRLDLSHAGNPDPARAVFYVA
jgi:hypothetical protein